MSLKLAWLATPLLLVCVHLTEAQQPKKVLRIGYLSSADPVSDSARSQGVLLALRELGYIDGQNIAMEYRYAAGNRGQAANLAAELVRLKVDILIIAGGTVWVRAAKNATKTIPIVMTGAGLDPVEAGLVRALLAQGETLPGLQHSLAEK